MTGVDVGRHRKQRQSVLSGSARAAAFVGVVGLGTLTMPGVAGADPAPPVPPLAAPALPGPVQQPSQGAPQLPRDDPAPPADDPASAPPPCEAKAKACVRLSTDQAWLMRDGKVVYGDASITSGDSDNPTPTGIFHVVWKDKNHVSKEYPGAEMPYSVFFDTAGRAFHEGDLDYDSAGCIHLTHDDAVRFFDYLQKGDEVEIVD